jgi:hypothetical protein
LRKDSGYELDHFFVAVPGLDAGTKALESAGFDLGPPHPHPGQGTASRGVIFESTYLELIWLTDVAEAESDLIRRTRLADRLRTGSGACPFGLGLRRTAEAMPEFPFDTWHYSPPYLPEGTSFQMASTSETLSQPLVFYLPWVSAPALPRSEHPNGARRVTRLELFLVDGAERSPTLSALSAAGLVMARSGGVYRMTVELDHCESGESLDLRPEIPLRIEW